MSEERIANLALRVWVPLASGKKTVKIELFGMAKFRPAWTKEKRKTFSPRAPTSRITDFNKYWDQEIFRVRVDGKWHGEAKYRFFDWPEIAEMMRTLAWGKQL